MVTRRVGTAFIRLVPTWIGALVFKPTEGIKSFPKLLLQLCQLRPGLLPPPPPPQCAGGNGLAPATRVTLPAMAPTSSPLSSIFHEPSITSATGPVGRHITAFDRWQSINSIVSSSTGTGTVLVKEPVCSHVPSSETTSILLNSSDELKPPPRRPSYCLHQAPLCLQQTLYLIGEFPDNRRRLRS